MSAVTIFVLIASSMICGWGSWQLHKAKKQQKINTLLSATLQDLYIAAETEVQKNKKLVEKARDLHDGTTNLEAGLYMTGAENIMDDAGMLATLVTVLVHKYGDIKLGLADFTSLGDDDFVSVYVDTANQDLILSLKKDLETTGMTAFANFSGSDDETYH